ncbi:signal peptide peptidase SppA [Aliarcobacter skirrowii]|uniref:Signal peptide peptidase SppA n=1 Tax=Aliarcobacter skirrowii CCUG 10374 TaxID=1032239 RepID=A0AAD0WNZ7_9BACT|nr:signal peptide peptidase SppA [Aliarcobacter skirrowii]AXX85424.1 signal peptide peptidase protease IV [Aliarcobacter skirrowii CCUG 10374]KAB0621164.1 signal peptide peptidase SppA [Aliarcobacter skirrowii CCUG 10374]RXI26335.1 signal peptide peptidase SppA [Aliarcobacter skirrowii CCUG 10374]SUU96041.1 Protease 4 [Aliarcobacter skirrowii]HAC71203.1 signal peptide peptidase SppA [Aliarcobacter skirrowii]
MFDFIKKLFSPVIWFFDFVTKYFKTIVFLTIVYFLFFSSNDEELMSNNFANLQKIDLIGEIVDPTKVLENIEKAKNDTNIKGVLLFVNSPGGAVAPSIEIALAIKELQELKPVVVYASGTIASGSYYASIWANKIIANPGTIVGSIGVIMQGFDASELLQKVGVQTQTVKAGKYKESGTITRRWTDFEQKELQNLINSTYNMFVLDVATARNLNIKNQQNFADAKVFTAQMAKDVGLVDEVSNITFAKNSLIELSQVEKAVWKKEDKFEKFMDKFLTETISKIVMSFSSSLKAI